MAAVKFSPAPILQIRAGSPGKTERKKEHEGWMSEVGELSSPRMAGVVNGIGLWDRLG